jgi:hypothetical protein
MAPGWLSIIPAHYHNFGMTQENLLSVHVGIMCARRRPGAAAPPPRGRARVTVMLTGFSESQDLSEMAARLASVFALCACLGLSSAFVVPHGGNLRLAASGIAARKSATLALHSAGRKRNVCSSLTMKLPSQRDPTPEELEAQRAYEIEMEKRYIKENSGLGYRKNSQDSLLAVMGKQLPHGALHSLLLTFCVMCCRCFNHYSSSHFRWNCRRHWLYPSGLPAVIIIRAGCPAH